MLTVLFLAAWSSYATAQDVAVTIRLVNGKNGKPITDENLNIFRNQTHLAENFKADQMGLIKLTIDRNALISFGSNIEVTCHKFTEAERSQHQLQQYKVSDILQHGITDTNTCSKKITVEAHPGEFVYFERPRTMWEWWML